MGMAATLLVLTPCIMIRMLASIRDCALRHPVALRLPRKTVVVIVVIFGIVTACFEVFLNWFVWYLSVHQSERTPSREIHSLLLTDFIFTLLARRVESKREAQQ